MHGQRKFIKFQGDAFCVQRLKVAAQGEIDIGPRMGAVQSARAKNDGFADTRIPGQNVSDGLK